MLAISDSCSSRSTSLFSSGLSSSSSQTDFSPPQSPTLDDKKPIDHSRHQTISGTCETPLFICEATPRQSSWKRATNIFDVSHDVGYESEREDCDTPILFSTKKSIRKAGFEARRRGLRLAHSASPKELKSSPVCPSQPRLLPIVGLDSPSPILLPSLLHLSGSNLCRLQRDMRRVSSSEILESPGLTCLHSPLRQENVVCSGVNMATANSEAGDTSNFCVLSTISKTRKAASGIGLGLPSVLCRPHSSKEENKRLVSTDVPSPRHESMRESGCYVQESFSIPPVGLGIIAGARRFLRTRRYPKRHLYDIPEHHSPQLSCKIVAMGKSHSSLSTAGLSPVARDLSKLRRLHSPLLNACKKPLQWFSSRSPTTGRRTSPVIVHDDVLQTMNLAPRRSADPANAAVLF